MYRQFLVKTVAAGLAALAATAMLAVPSQAQARFPDSLRRYSDRHTIPSDLYCWAEEEMRDDVGKTLGGRKIIAADRFALYYNDYNLEWSAPKMAHVRNLIRHVRAGGGRVDGLGFQAHIEANGLAVRQFGTNIAAAIADGLRFAVTEADCAINETPHAGQPSVAEQEANQGREMGAGLCVKYRNSCDCFQIWGATDDGSWIQNGEATPVTR